MPLKSNIENNSLIPNKRNPNTKLILRNWNWRKSNSKGAKKEKQKNPKTNKT